MENKSVLRLHKIRLNKEIKMPRGDKTGPEGKGPKTGRGLGPCEETTEKQLDTKDKDTKDTTEKQLETQRGTGRGPCGDGEPRGGGKGNSSSGGKGGRRKGTNGITYF